MPLPKLVSSQKSSLPSTVGARIAAIVVPVVVSPPVVGNVVCHMSVMSPSAAHHEDPRHWEEVSESEDGGEGERTAPSPETLEGGQGHSAEQKGHQDPRLHEEDDEERNSQPTETFQLPTCNTNPLK